LNPDGGGGVVPHNELAGLQGGTATERYHIDEDQYDAVNGANNPSSTNVFATIADVGIVQPNGLVQIGTKSQAGNDITVNADWIWRFNQVSYQKLTTTPFTITPPATDFTRIDLVYGNTSGDVLIVTGTEVESPDPALPPNLPANSVGFFLVFSNDTGITGFEDFALSSFVRFDVDNQNLSLVQRQNARTNIQALSTDTNDNYTGNILNIRNAIDNQLIFRFLNSSPQTTLGGRATFEIYGRQPGGGTRTMVTWFDGEGDWNFSMIRNGQSEFKKAAPRHPRSTAADLSVRRDEIPFNYPQTVATTGTINNLSLTNEGVKLLILTLADDLTGVVPVTTNTGRELKIEGRNAGGVIIRHDSASSTAANRFSLPGATDLTIANGEVYTFIYTNSRWRLVIDKNEDTEGVERENNTVLFDKDYVIGNAGARTGNILFDFTGARLMSTSMMLHNDSSIPTFPAQSVIIGGFYEINVNNYIYFQLTRKTLGSEIVLITISQPI
jgi:hypothetical protein